MCVGGELLKIKANKIIFQNMVKKGCLGAKKDYVEGSAANWYEDTN